MTQKKLLKLLVYLGVGIITIIALSALCFSLLINTLHINTVVSIVMCMIVAWLIGKYSSKIFN